MPFSAQRAASPRTSARRSARLAAAAALSQASLLAALLGCGSSGQPFVASPASTPNPPAAIPSGPQLGYIWSDTAHTLRPVLGVPGATQLGQSVVPASLYLAGAASNLSSLALLQESDGSLDLMSLPAGQPTRLAASLPPGAHLRFAPSGLAAIAFLPGSTGVTLLTNLRNTPILTSVSTSQVFSDAVVSDAGSIAVAVPTPTGASIRMIPPSGAGSLAATVTTLGGFTFAGTADDLLVADAAANTLTLIHAASSNPALTFLPTGGLLKTPLGLGASRDGRWALLANAGEPTVVRVDLTAQTAPQRLTCDCQPATVAPLSGTAVFRLTSADTGPAWIVDAAATAPRTLFIPASLPATTTKAGSH